MKSEFIFNETGMTLINVAHISTISISCPCYEQKDYRVVCSVSNMGTQTLFRGSLEKCKAFLSDFHYTH